MSLTGRPSSPPLALTSSSQILWASSADLPLAARPPVIAMPKPILIGVPDCAAAPPARPSDAATTAAAASADLSLKSMSSPPVKTSQWRVGRHIRAISKPCARGAAIGPNDAPPLTLVGRVSRGRNPLHRGLRGVYHRASQGQTRRLIRPTRKTVGVRVWHQAPPASPVAYLHEQLVQETLSRLPSSGCLPDDRTPVLFLAQADGPQVGRVQRLQPRGRLVRLGEVFGVQPDLNVGRHRRLEAVVVPHQLRHPAPQLDLQTSSLPLLPPRCRQAPDFTRRPRW